MEAQFIDTFIQSGIAGVVAYIAIRAVSKLYKDMTETHKCQLSQAYSREKELMKCIDKLNDTVTKIAHTLDNINHRIDAIEKIIDNE